MNNNFAHMVQCNLSSIAYEFDYSGGYWKYEGEPVSYMKVQLAVKNLIKSLDSSSCMTNKQIRYCVEDILSRIENGRDEDDYS